MELFYVWGKGMRFIKKHWLKGCLLLSFIIIGFGVYNQKNVKSIVFYDGEGKLLKEDMVVELSYQEGKLLEVTAMYLEKISNPEGSEVSVQVLGEVDMNTLGEYPVVYRAEHNDFAADLTIIYEVKDTTAPVITLEGDEDFVLYVGEEYEEPGFSAMDNLDGDVTEQVIVTGEPDPYRDFDITYSVTDTNGNTCEVKRHVSVEVGEHQKVMYLTFDDGPSAYTKRLLDVLDEYEVKATFFVTGNNLKYADMIGEAFRRGHSIALHTYSHEYAIYSSPETYYEDLQKIQDLVVEQTGQEAKIVRFPGGTSNTTSANYCEGIMTFLAEDLGKKGYLYCDWNVSSGDGGGAFDEMTVILNVMNFSQGIRKAIVLQHDSQPFSVDAVDDIILYARSQGYILLPLTEDSEMLHQNINN